ncbi:TetR/AcrR family transcriptional regulator [Streptomyces sp. NPDC014734]|uniref:TetR/AcrR family transcriptional regulator n=1 Tax=Streptomyces sp. NPDC014734 TaxID=3364886 RepID=UPI0036F925C5
MRDERRAPLRPDAQRNRTRILDAALAELTGAADVPLSAIARRAGVGQGTLYRNFPDREALVLEVYRHEMRQVADTAAQLLRTRTPDRALREWMDRLAQYAMAKAGLADALRGATGGHGGLARLGHGPVTRAVSLLLNANEAAGTIRPGLVPEDFLLAIAGLWQIDPHGDWQPRATRLLDLVMDGLRVGAPGTGDPVPDGTPVSGPGTGRGPADVPDGGRAGTPDPGTGGTGHGSRAV